MKFLGVLCFLSCILLSSCATSDNSKTTQSALLEPQNTLRFSDVPVPVGLKALPKDSYIFENGGVRVGVLKYRGKVNIDQAVSFYKEQMPMYGWSLLNVIEYGERMLNFDRVNETCIITLIPNGSVTTVSISLGPKATQAAKKTDKPLK